MVCSLAAARVHARRFPIQIPRRDMSSFYRHWLAIAAAGLACAGSALAQSEDAGSSSGSALGSSGGSGSVFGSGSGSSSSFNVFSSAPPTSSEGPGASAEPITGTDTGTALTPNLGPMTSTSAREAEAAPSFTVPGFYGQGSTTFFGGAGRLARPRFETSVAFGFGYDDNLSQTPRNTPNIAPGVAQVIEPGEDVLVQVGEEFVDGTNFRETRPVYATVRTPDRIVEVPIPVPTQERIASLFARTGLALEMQSYTRRSLFTMNVNLNDTYYFNRDDDPNELSGNVNLTYLYRITPRLQITTQLNSAYISQPDLSRPNTPGFQTQGDLINTLARVDLSYRVTPRLSTSLTGNYSGNRYTEEVEQTGDFDEFTAGLELRYLWKPRWTLLAEVRHGMTTYAQRTDLDSTTSYLLIGSEFILNPRLSGSLRLGEALKTFDSRGSTQSSPYVESSLIYRSTARSSVQWTNRFGFEEPGSPDEQRLVYRSTLAFNYMFTPRLRGTVSANLMHEVTENELLDTSFAQDTFDSTLALEYQWTRRFSLNASYTFTLVNTNIGLIDYYRNRVFFGGQYRF